MIMKQAIRGFVAVTLSVLALQVQPAVAQDTPYWISGTGAAAYTQYYLPYALQAAAAYRSVDDFNDTRRPGARARADVALAVSYSYPVDGPEKAYAAALLAPWRYQFGSEGHLTCFDPSDGDCQNQLREARRFGTGSGPAFQVWARTRYPHREHEPCTEVSIAFRGTTGSAGDWFSNFDRVNFLTDDYYLQLQRNINRIIRKITTIDCYRRAPQPPQIVSLGHSLGGGLAQFAALANKPGGPRIAKVFAFDPSPVTGVHRIDNATLQENARGLTIDRIYQTGEVLAVVRKYYQEYPASSSTCDPYVRTVLLDALRHEGSVKLHNMPGLARELVRLSYRFRTLPFDVPPGTDCPTRYLAPEEGVPGPAIAYAPNGAVVRTANGNRYAGAYRYVQTNPYGTAYRYARDWGGSTPATPARLKPPGARTVDASTAFDMGFAQPNWYDATSFYPNATDAGVARPTVVRGYRRARFRPARPRQEHPSGTFPSGVSDAFRRDPICSPGWTCMLGRLTSGINGLKASGPRNRGEAVSG
jgi:hypothetical protein